MSDEDVRLEPMPEEPEEKKSPKFRMGECDCCRFEMVRTKRFKDVYLCRLCSCTMTSQKDDEVLKTICFVGNEILREIRSRQ